MATVQATATTRLQTVEVGERSLASYLNVVPIHILEALDREAEKLRGARILQLNATPYGGGVSELLRSGVPLLADLGLDVDWRSSPATSRSSASRRRSTTGCRAIRGC